jgi:uncharacterized protein YdeI (YjbR/CyaY-like superfamily)
MVKHRDGHRTSQDGRQQMEILCFATATDFRGWLEQNHGHSNGIWLRIYKKDSGLETVSYPQALDISLCFGWIDGQKKAFDERSWLQKFTPRRPKSGWSKRNTEHAERLIRSGEMTAAGSREIEAAKADGRWEAAYDSFGESKIPEDFLKELRRNKKAKAFFDTLNKTNLYSIAYRLQTAKNPVTREKRKQMIIAMLAREETFH